MRDLPVRPSGTPVAFLEWPEVPVSRRNLVAFITAAITALAPSVTSAQTFTSKTDVTTLRPAASAGNVDAMFYLGLKYHSGITKPQHSTQVPQDFAQAAAWYGRASALGHRGAMYFLGTFYWSGRGVTKDLVEAYKWLYLSGQSAPEQSRVRSAQTCESLARVMSAAQVAEAKQRAADWQTASTHKK